MTRSSVHSRLLVECPDPDDPLDELPEPAVLAHADRLPVDANLLHLDRRVLEVSPHVEGEAAAAAAERTQLLLVVLERPDQ